MVPRAQLRGARPAKGRRSLSLKVLATRLARIRLVATKFPVNRLRRRISPAPDVIPPSAEPKELGLNVHGNSRPNTIHGSPSRTQ